jgi:carbamoyl-phosphate synthase small subunit
MLALKPAGVFLSNGPGDPAATGRLCRAGDPGLLDATCRSSGSALATRCWRLRAGPRPSRCTRAIAARTTRSSGWSDGVVEITSMNHGFAVDNCQALPLRHTVEETHVSLFDGSNCGIAVKGKKAFGVQYQCPEASPGPQDSF